MTPTDEGRFITPRQQGIDTAEMAQRLGSPRGTVGSRAKRLVERGEIQPRPRGGAYPSQRAKARTLPQGTPAPTCTLGTIKQWTVRLSQPLIEAVKAKGMTDSKELSHLVEELLWKALSDRRSSMP